MIEFYNFISGLILRTPVSVWIMIIEISLISFVLVKDRLKSGSLKKTVAVSRGIIPVYIMILLTFTYFLRQVNQIRYWIIQPFWSYKMIIEYGRRDLLIGNIGNILMFVPWTILFGLAKLKYKEREIKCRLIVFSGIAFSVLIEIIQLITKYGVFETDDIINNTAGILIGAVVYKIYLKYKTNM